MIEASCHCGGVRLEIATAPETVTDCRCSTCRKLGALWAYYHPKQVKLTPSAGGTDVYMCSDRVLKFHRCKFCGCITHWADIDPEADRMAVNARLMEPEVLAAARVRISAGPSPPT